MEDLGMLGGSKEEWRKWKQPQKLQGIVLPNKAVFCNLLRAWS